MNKVRVVLNSGVVVEGVQKGESGGKNPSINVIATHPLIRKTYLNKEFRQVVDGNKERFVYASDKAKESICRATTTATIFLSTIREIKSI